MPINDPTDLPGLVQWLDADQETGLSDGDNVSSWTDQSGNGNHATQATAANQPKWYDEWIVGKAALVFEGDDWLQVPDALLDIDGATQFVVARMALPVTSSSAFLVGFRTVSSGNGRWYIFNNSGTWRTMVGDTAGDVGGEVDYDLHRFMLRADGATKTAKVDDDSTTYSDAQTGSISHHREVGSLGGTNRWQGQITEVIVYNRALSDAEVTDVENYIDDKWFPTPAGNDPVGISGCVLWLDADQEAFSDGDRPARWRDRSNHEHDAVQATSGERPFFRTGVVGSKDAMEFDATAGSWMQLLSGPSFDMAAGTTFVVAQASTASGMVLSQQHRNPADFGQAKHRWYVTFDTGPQVTESMGGSTYADEPPVVLTFSDISLDTPYVLMAQSDGTDQDGAARCPIQTDSASVAMSGTTGTRVLGRISPDGTSEQFDGYIAEIVHYNRRLTDAEVSQVTTHLANKYGLSCVTLRPTVGYVGLG